MDKAPNLWFQISTIANTRLCKEHFLRHWINVAACFFFKYGDVNHYKCMIFNILVSDCRLVHQNNGQII